MELTVEQAARQMAAEVVAKAPEGWTQCVLRGHASRSGYGLRGGGYVVPGRPHGFFHVPFPHQGLAADDFNQSFNRTASVAAGGQQANNSVAQVGSVASGRISDLLTQQGNARASGYAGQAQAWGGALKDIAGLFQ